MFIDWFLIMQKSNKIVLLDIDDTLFNTEKLINSSFFVYELYKEVTRALYELSTIASLGIFSQGEIAFQKKKLRETNIEQYFSDDHIHIMEFKLEMMQEILETYHNKGKVFVIDDRLENLHMAKKSAPFIFTIWMKRGRYANIQEQKADFLPDAIINKLNEAIPIISAQ